MRFKWFQPRVCVLLTFSLGLLAINACFGIGAHYGISKPQIFIGEGLIEYKELFSIQPSQNGGRLQIYDVLPTSQPTELAVASSERSKEGRYIGGFLRIVDSVTGAVHSLQPMECSPIDLNGDDRFEATCNGGGFSDVALVDADGNDVWVFDGGGYEKRGGAANDLAVGDIDGDGDLEFCIGFSESLGCFDERGEEIWRENDKSFGYNQVLIINGTSSLVLAVRYPYLSRDDYSLIVRTGSGELLFNRTVSRGFHFDLAQWPPDQTEPSLVTATDSSFAFRNLEGELKLEYAIPDALVADEDVDSFACEYVVLEMDSQKYLLVNYTAEYVQLAFSPSPVRSAILLYDTSGNLVYFEVLDDLVTIVSLADTQTGVKKILMLKRGTIFEILAPSQPPPVIMAP